jgi:glycosyltransferase involved in cell wall biosynthesis
MHVHRSRNPLRLGLVGQVCATGGAEEFMRLLAELVDQKRGHVVGFAFELGVSSEDRARQLAQYAPVTHGPDAIRRLCEESDVVILWGVQRPARILPPLPRQFRLILVSQGDDWACCPSELAPSWRYTSHVFSGAEQADGIVACSQAALSSIPPEQRHRAEVIFNCGDEGRTRATEPSSTVRSGLGLGAGEKLAGFLGRLSNPDKNPKVLIDALQHLPSDWRVVFAGTGPHERDVRAYALERYPGRVVFTGHRWDVGNLLSVFDCLVMPSLTEGFSLALVEAWMARVPVLATRVGGVADFPGLVRVVESHGSSIAEGILSDAADALGVAARVELAHTTAFARFSGAAFGKAWSDYIERVAAG